MQTSNFKLQISNLLFLVLITLSGCAGRQEIRPSKVLPVTVADILKKMEESSERVHSLKGLANIKVTYNGSGTNVKEVVVVKRPEKMRLETIGLFGNPVLILATDGHSVSIYEQAENRFYKGDISSRDIVLPFPLNLLGTWNVPDMLLGGTSVIKYGKGDIEFSDAEKRYVLTLRSADGFRRQVITVDAENLRLMKSETIDGERGMALSVAFSDYQDVDNIPFPKDIKIQFADKPDILQIRYEDIELNKEAADELFVITPPENSNK